MRASDRPYRPLLGKCPRLLAIAAAIAQVQLATNFAPDLVEENMALIPKLGFRHPQIENAPRPAASGGISQGRDVELCPGRRQLSQGHGDQAGRPCCHPHRSAARPPGGRCDLRHRRLARRDVARTHGRSTQIWSVPTKQTAIEKATFVVSTWFASIDPVCIKLRREKGQRWVKITYFRNLDLLLRRRRAFPVDLVGEIIRATARLYPRQRAISTCPSPTERGTDSSQFHARDGDQLHKDNRWRGGQWPTRRAATCITCRPMGRTSTAQPASARHERHMPATADLSAMGHRLRQAVRGEDRRRIQGRLCEGARPLDDAEILRDMLVGVARSKSSAAATIPRRRASRSIRPAPTRRARCTSANELKERVHAARHAVLGGAARAHGLVIFDTTVKAGNSTLIDNGFLMALRDPQVVAAAERYGDPVELLENFPV